MNKDTLKKHHFWLLLGFIPLLVMIAVIVITSSVGAAIEEKRGAVAKTKSELQTKSSPKPTDLVVKLDLQRQELEKKQTALWKENWERQIGVVNGKQDPAQNLLRWPGSRKLARFNYTADYQTDREQLKFGDPIPDPEGEPNEFRKLEVYRAEFSNAAVGFPGTGMADRVAPTTFNGGWERVLRHVAFPPPPAPNGWGDRQPSSEQIWLALEDIWVQRSMLAQVKAVNDQIAAFAPAPPRDGAGPAKPLSRAFESRVWRVELAAAPRPSDGRFVITGTLENLTDRLQLLGNGNTMVLNVWLSPDPNLPPFAFRIGGEFVPGRQSMKIVQTEEHVLPPLNTPTELARVEQVFDTRTVPIRRVEKVALGYRDSRQAAVPLELPRFEVYKKAEEAEKAAATGTGGPTGSSGSGTPSPPRPSGTTGGSGGSTGGPDGAGGGPVETVIDTNKKRYVRVTQHVRRMPVAMTIIVDQAYVQDVLLAAANSPLRTQVTQVHWQRFRGPLAGGVLGGSGGEGDGAVLYSGPGVAGVGLTGAGGDAAGLRPVAGLRTGFPGFGPANPTGSSPTSPPSPPGTGTPGGGRTAVTESQLTAGLIELTVYSTVSLYEKYNPTPTPGQTPAGK